MKKQQRQRHLLESKITLSDMKCVPVHLSGNYFNAKMKFVALLDPLKTYQVAFLMPFSLCKKI